MCNFCNLKLESCRVRVHPQRIRQHSVCYTCRNSDWQQRRGIPMIVPGERITSTIVQKMVKYKEMGFSIEGLSQENCLLVARNPE